MEPLLAYKNEFLQAKKTILANGCIYENTDIDPEDHSQTKHFWIEVKHGNKP